MTPSALVTGAGGFVGRWLVRALLDGGWTVTAATQSAPDDAGELAAATWMTGDVRDMAHLRAAVDAGRPDAIFHLAGVSFVPAAASDPGYAAEINILAAARLLGVVRERRAAGTLDPVVLLVGSGEEYGRHEPAEFPLPESAELRPYTAYAATKVAQEALGLAAWRSDGVRVIATRSFNHSGPGQDPRFLLPGLVTRVRALRGAPPGAPLVMGNQTTVRDFLHVADVVAAYIALVERGGPGNVYNVASGVGHSVGDLARRVLARARSDAPIASDPALVRPAEVPALVGSPARLRADTGWAPRRTLDDIIDDLLAAV